MTVRRLNYTARQRISHADVDVVLHVQLDGFASFDVGLDLAAYEFPADARIFIEAYRQTTLMRFDFGTVAMLVPPTLRQLTEFATADEVLFRVKVTAASGQTGILQGEADRIRPRMPDEQPDHRIPLLPPVPHDLGEEMWRVDFEGGTYLHVNRELHDWKETVKSNAFRALVYPSAMRQVLERILFFEHTTQTDDPGNWCCRWLSFASTLPGSSPVPTARDAQPEWIDIAVAAFARKFGFRSKFSAEIAE